MRTKLTLLGFTLSILMSAGWGHAHCQIPCGIFGDKARFEEIREHFTTIEKSIKLIHELSAAKQVDQNQLVRWVMNKEDHAHKINEILTYYFMAQRIVPQDPSDKAAYRDYQAKVEVLHRLLVGTMKTKQSADVKRVAELRLLLDRFEKLYFAD